jgi:uncharacterized LabA/DUF88 family protein
MDEKNKKQKVIFYIDGYNFYNGLKENNWKKYYWLDIVKFCSMFINNDNQEIECVKYFSAIDHHQYKALRQDKFFEANKANPKFKLILGYYLLKDSKCPICDSDYKTPEEKKTDVNISTHLITDCVNNKCDISILISGDGDLTPPFEFIKTYKPHHVLTVFFPPKRGGFHLKQIAHNSVYLMQYNSRFKDCILPDKIEIEDGIYIYKPERWSAY